jgi:SRSO17 transposase
VPDEIRFQTKPQIALGLVNRALTNGVRVTAWTCDELYGRDSQFLDGLEQLDQVFVAEVPVNFHGWLREPKVLRNPPQNGRGRGKKYPRLARRPPACEVQNLLKYSPHLRDQSWQRYHIKNTDRGPEVWEVKWSGFWRKKADGLPGRRHCLIVARNVLTGEVKYFISNRVPGQRGITLRWLLRVAFGRWVIESCFRQGKEELGLDHYQVRGWRCMHRHFFVTQLAHLFCARMRQKYDDPDSDQLDRLTVEQVRAAINAWLTAAEMKPAARQARYERALRKQRYYQRRNRQARHSHTKTRLKQLASLGIEIGRIKTCIDAPPR